MVVDLLGTADDLVAPDELHNHHDGMCVNHSAESRRTDDVEKFVLLRPEAICDQDEVPVLIQERLLGAFVNLCGNDRVDLQFH